MFGAELGRSIGPLLVVFAVQSWGTRGVSRLAILGILGSMVLYWRLRDVPFQPTHSATPGLPWRQAIGGMSTVMVPIMSGCSVQDLVIHGE